MARRNFATQGMNSLRLITLDMTGTIFKFKRAPYLDYIDVAALYGINNLIEKDVSNSFKKAFKAVNDEFPNFGGNSSISSQDWWCKVVLETFKGAIADFSPQMVSKIECVAVDLYKLYSTTKPYAIYPDAKQFLTNIESKRECSNLKVGVISNYDKRIVGIVEELQLSTFIDFITYSEESQSSKPQKQIFENGIKKSGLTNLKGEEILHIGDDFKKDYLGAKNLGWNALLIQRDPEAKNELLNNDSSKTIIDGQDICDNFSDVERRIFNLP